MSDKQLATFMGMGYVKDEYTKSGLTDTKFAEWMTEQSKSCIPKMEWSVAQVRQYRQSLKIPNNAPRTEDSAKVTEAKELFQALLLHCGADLTSDLRKQVEEYIA